MGEEIAALADRSDDIHSLQASTAANHRHNVMVRIVECRADQVVHASIYHQKLLTAILLAIDDAREQHAGAADQRPARLKQQVIARSRQWLQDGLGVFLRNGGEIVSLIAVVIDPE